MIAERFKPENQPLSGVEEVVSLFCPQTSSSVILDAAIHQIAATLDADVFVLDAIDLIAGEKGPFGCGTPAVSVSSLSV